MRLNISILTENLINGVIGSFWFTILILNFFKFNINFDEINLFLNKFSYLKYFLMIYLISFVYQLGVIINGFSFFMLNIVSGNKIRNKLFNNNKLDHNEVHSYVIENIKKQSYDDICLD